ncbi:hypothetical protein Poli38472_011679 [Pythium oligandrum]|uniref:NAD(P)-binding domain-containing protein n=1 Tax=Pythium oligandrum TaxID=41045 RepID=A0A8K1C808_PYTOL|nr:hypothetical protein Poli38472_011679 [Pythium oligandrum]|eukprot:TMW58091.1 hypothetical protein Poli38472_011679 [Pythium oligandrum]
MGTKTILLPLTKHTTLTAQILTIASKRGSRDVSFRIARAADASVPDQLAVDAVRTKSPWLIPERSDYVVDFTKTKDLSKTMEGCDGVVLASGHDDPLLVENELNVLESAHASGVQDILKVSCAEGLVGANSSVGFGQQHWMVEQRLLELGFAGNVRILRPSTLMDVFLRGKLFEMICGRSLSVSVKRGCVAFVHPTDVVDVINKLLAQSTPGGSTTTHALTGPEALSFQQVAQQLSQGIHDQVTYSYFPLWAVQPSMWIRGERPEAIASEITLARARESGFEASVTSDIQELLGRPPRTFQEFVKEHHESWPLQAFK